MREFSQMLPAQSSAAWELKLQPPQDMETIAKKIRTFESDAEPSRGVRQVCGEVTESTDFKPERLDGQAVTAIVQSQPALMRGQQATQELLGRLVHQQLDNRHVSSSSREWQSKTAPRKNQRAEYWRCWN